MEKVHFVLGVHNHQPIGNFGFVFEKAYQNSYLPFLSAMERHPLLHWNMHTTGILWEWLEKNHPDYVDRVAEQVQAGRLELLTGGFYEPILPALPDADKLGQIQKLSRYLRQRFKTKAKGMWLAERVWEPHLAKILADAGIEYTLVDDSHFLTTGLTLEEMCGAFLSEEQGATVKVLPIRQDLRYAIPFREPGDTLNLLRQNTSSSGHKALVMFDDGEKFGLWPDTYKHVYEDGWLEKFLTVLESNKDWIITTRISDYLDTHVPHGRVYLPTASYAEMGEWTLPAKTQELMLGIHKQIDENVPEGKRFVRGGFWRNFLTKYDESNAMHKKMLYVSDKVHRAVAASGGNLQRPTGKTQKMLDSLWAGQCNCSYWHGVFGGLYLPHLRQAVYKELVEAEAMADKVLHPGATRMEYVDIDKDGNLEVLLESPDQNLYVAPAQGGSIFEWDLRGVGVNLSNTLTRRQEGYHRQLVEFAAHGPSTEDGVKTIHDIVRVKEPALEKRLFTDWYRRTSLLDHFLHPNTRLEDFYHCQYGEQGDFVKGGYRADVVRDVYPQVRLYRQGTVWSGEQKNTVGVEKTVTMVPAAGWHVVYRIQNIAGPSCSLWFGSELNVSFASPDRVETADLAQQTRWDRHDKALGLGVRMQMDLPMDLWEFPIETVSLSEEGFERTYQGTALLAHAKVRLDPGQVWVRSWKVTVHKE